MWSRGTRAGERLTSAANARLGDLARQWRPGSRPGEGAAGGAAETAANAWQAVLEDLGPRPSDLREEPAPRLTAGPWDRSAVRGLALLMAATALVAGWWWWAGRPHEAVAAPTVVAAGVPLGGALGSTPGTPDRPTPTGRASTVVPSGSATQVVVHVVGQVRHPGLVALPAGSRVDDAVTAAGGVSRPHAAESVNLARVLVDGEQIVVGFAAQAVAGALGVGASSAPALVNLNSADAATFETLPGVGPVLAERIVTWRTTNGPFRSIDELGEVSGIGDAIMGQLRPLVTV